MKFSTKNIVSIAILLASSLKTKAHPIEIKGVNTAVHVNNNSREFVEEQQHIDFTPYGKIFDIVCQSDLSEWCSIYPEQCSYVKALCVKNNNDYCAFDVYQKYIELVSASDSNNPINHIDLCDQCLVDMINEFINNSQDQDAIDEVKSFAEICKVKLFMNSFLSDGGNNDRDIISTLASLIPNAHDTESENKEKRNYVGVHAFKSTDKKIDKLSDFELYKGHRKFGNVGINEKINFKINNKNNLRNVKVSSKYYNKRSIEEGEIIVNKLKEKITNALINVKELAIQKVSTALNNLEINLDFFLSNNIYITDPENTKEKNALTEEIISNIKDILNNEDVKVEILEPEQATPYYDVFNELLENEDIPVEKINDIDVFVIPEDMIEKLPVEIKETINNIISTVDEKPTEAPVEEIITSVPIIEDEVTEAPNENEENEEVSESEEEIEEQEPQQEQDLEQKQKEQKEKEKEKEKELKQQEKEQKQKDKEQKQKEKEEKKELKQKEKEQKQKQKDQKVKSFSMIDNFINSMKEELNPLNIFKPYKDFEGKQNAEKKDNGNDNRSAKEEDYNLTAKKTHYINDKYYSGTSLNYFKKAQKAEKKN